MAGSFSAQTMAGTTVSISATLAATLDSAGYDALTFTLIAKLTDFDNIPSRVYDEVEFAPLDTREKERAKGLFLQETITANLADVQGDPGQEICKTALNSDECFAFKVVFQNGDIEFFQGRVTAFTKTGGDGNTIVGRTLTIVPAGDTAEVLVSGILTASVAAGGTYTGITDATAVVATQASTDGSGINAEFLITLESGAVTAIEFISNSGSGYIATETITLTLVGPTESVAATITVDSVLAAPA